MAIVNACVQNNFTDKMHGEWTIEITEDGDWYPDIIIFRTDWNYLVFNDLDFNGMPDTNEAYDIITDQNEAIALTEIGIWGYDGYSGAY